jgi:hypothetical protein
MGLLYERSRLALVGFAVMFQLVSIPLFIIAEKSKKEKAIIPT